MRMILRRSATQLIAAALLLIAWAATDIGAASEAERARLARRFHIEATPIPSLTPATRTIRAVRPSLAPIAAWISSVGAAVALHDIDGDGLSNDVLYVDVRSDEVVVAPVPGSGARFAAFDLLRVSGCAVRDFTAPMGVVPGDINEDGYADALVYFWGRSPLVYLRDATTPLATSGFRCRELLAHPEEWYSNAAAFADVDGDGHADVIIGNYFPDDSALLDPSSSSPAMEMQDSMSRAFNGGANRLLLWTPDGFRIVNNAFAAEVANGWTLALGAQDLNGDLLPEIYFANDFGPDRLLLNRSTRGAPRFELLEGRRRFFDPKSKVLGRDSFKGMGIDFADLNDDGVPDLFVSNITDTFALEESTFLFVSTNGTLDYRDASERMGVARGGWGWDARFGDFDNDGTPELLQAAGFVRGAVNRWPELHELAMTNDTLLREERNWPKFDAGTDLSGDNRNPFYVRSNDGRYHDVAAEVGIEPGTVSRGIATADVDGDGRLDFAVANQWQPSTFFRNRSRGGASLVLHLRFAPLSSTMPTSTTVLHGVVRGGTSPAIGATANVTTPKHRLSAQVDGGNGHSGKRGPELHFGLGDERAASVELHWRDRQGRVMQHRLRLEAGVWTVMLGNGGAS